MGEERNKVDIKICPICNKEIKVSDITKMCYDCGKTYHKECWSKNKGCNTENCGSNPNTKSSTGNSGIGFLVGGILGGILSLIFGIVIFSMNVGTFVSSHSYGGDAYTGIQNAAAYTASNTKYLAEITRFGLGSILVVMGIVCICFFAHKIAKK